MEEFERRTRELLEESAQRLDGRTRSRLSQARHAALAAAHEGRASAWLSRLAGHGWAPAGAVAAAAVLAMLLWVGRPEGVATIRGEAPAGFEDLELIADGETFELLESADQEFYEWALMQAAGDVDAAAVES